METTVSKDHSDNESAAGESPLALVVDDSRTGRRIVETLLSLLGFSVIEAATVGEALAAVKERCFSLITVDRVLEKDDGVELVRTLRALSSCSEDTRILALTGHVGEEHSNAFFEAGADAYLTKPFNVRDLAEILIAFGFDLNRAPPFKDAA